MRRLAERGANAGCVQGSACLVFKPLSGRRSRSVPADTPVAPAAPVAAAGKEDALTKSPSPPALRSLTQLEWMQRVSCKRGGIE